MRPVRLALAAVAVMASTAAACASQLPPTAGSSAVPPTTSIAASTGPASPSPTPEAEAGESVSYEATGSGTAITVDYAPDADGASARIENVPLPFEKEVAVAGSPTLYEIVIVGGDNVGCTISIGGRVVAQEPAGGSAHCIYQP